MEVTGKMINTYKKFKHEIDCLIEGDDKIAVAVSGGSDSMALALLLGDLANESGIDFITITVDHNLRSESAGEAIQVGKWLGKYGIKHHILKWDGEKTPSNIQAKARKARHRLMADFCSSMGIKTLCVGHTSDDQAETLLIRLMRGSGVDGLAAIAPSSRVFGIRVIRPILNFTKQDLRQYLTLKKQEWVEDPSNENNKFTRVSVRKLINASDNPTLLNKRLAVTASHMARAKNYIEEKVRQSLVGIFTFNNLGFYTIDINKFKELHEEERLRSLAACLQHTGGKEYKTRFNELVALDKRIIDENPRNGCTLWGCSIAPSHKKGEENLLFIYREPALASQAIKIKINSHNSTEWDGRFNCTIKDTDIEGLRIGALTKDGYNGLSKTGFEINLMPKFNECILPSCSRKASAGVDFFVPKKIIYSLPALWSLEKLLAVPHISYYADDSIKNMLDIKVKSPPYLFHNKGLKNA